MDSKNFQEFYFHGGSRIDKTLQAYGKYIAALNARLADPQKTPLPYDDLPPVTNEIGKPVGIIPIHFDMTSNTFEINGKKIPKRKLLSNYGASFAPMVSYVLGISKIDQTSALVVSSNANMTEALLISSGLKVSLATPVAKNVALLERMRETYTSRMSIHAIGEIKRWYLFDGAKFAPSVLDHPRIKVFSGRNGFVTDGTIPKILEMTHGHQILFISDIRSVPSEENVKAEMVAQARWGLMMDASAMLLKFRPPYPNPKSMQSSVLSPIPHDFSSTPLEITGSSIKKGREFLYLDGVIQPQLFAPMNSTETRLYVTRPYRLKWYDVVAYERESYFYNISVRRMTMPTFLPRLDLYIPGFDRGFESIQCYKIAHVYAPLNALHVLGQVMSK
ncbi:hypothetical protein CEUSTIGMA_g12683.t1 [Chlamydomonas eustigma]|uniref:Uncharacterized protein n=1 Tax=Chlamydomonas eustigma TaxID=1157962 RepID=A0A250XQC6_9CHLO|nr:hypothetical protein CEUSTIGMA_g12683.t1 [Chlamydomonas eustigma]|eukprot:GAX85264.1 hypothetical protein CEUSTIGMA_g12683.t1 [Chlamydomonas eustigma]